MYIFDTVRALLFIVRAMLLLIIIGICAVTDLAWQRIPNRIVAAGFISGAILYIVSAVLYPEKIPIFDLKTTDISYGLQTTDIPHIMAGSAGSVNLRAGGEITSLAYSIIFIILLIFLFSIRLMGAGDIKLYAFVIFMYPGSLSLNIIIISMLTAGVISAAKLIKRHLISGHSVNGTLPLAVFIFIASLIAVIMKGELIWRG